MKNFGTTECVTCGSEFDKTGPRSKYCSGACKPALYNLTCEYCGEPFGNRKNPRARFCSREHMALAGGSISDNPGRKLSRGNPGFRPNAPEILKASSCGEPSSWLLDRGYITYYWPGHPAVPKGHRIFESRAVAYEVWGDAILGNHVDHINGDKMDNDPSNLQILSRSDHATKTALQDSGYAFLAWAKANRPEIVDEWTDSKTKEPFVV